MKNFKSLEKNLGVKFKNAKLLAKSLTHRSYLNEAKAKDLESNERLEFLGDSILSFIISDWLFRQYPQYPEGTLTNVRSNLVKTEALAQMAKKLKIGEYLFLSKGEKESGGKTNPSLLADAMEAITGAVYLDQSYEGVRSFINDHFQAPLRKLITSGRFKDYKSLLQEKLQAEKKQSPIYKTLKEEGPDHNKIFTVGVFDGKKLLARGKGKSKQSAEGEAAKKALEKEKRKWKNCLNF